MDYYNSNGIFDNSTYKNFATFTGGLSASNIVTGIRGKGLQFDGISDSINVKDSNSLDIGTSDFSISFWGNFGTQDGGYSAIIGKKAGSWADTASGYEVIITDSGKIFLHFSDGNNYVSTSWTSTNFSNAGWKHVVITVNRDGNAIIYVNGIAEKTGDISTAHGSLTNSLNLGIMTRSDGNYAANGLLDEVMIFNRALSATEVLALYDSKVNKFDATFSNLTNGQHTYSVYAIDGDGNIASSSRTFSVNATGAVTCSGLNTQTCTITNGVGSQTRTCNNGVWGAPYGTCIVQSCNSGYTQSGSSCIISSMCTNDCSSSGLKQCSGNGYQTCGNYDSDSCLEWSSVTACPNGGTCSGSGNCGVFTGTIHYIDAVSGVDSSIHGSITAPWKTLAYACSQVKTSGDLIHVNAGTYTETSQCNLAVGVSIEGEGATSIIQSNYAGGETEGFIGLDSPSGNPVSGNQSISYIKIDGRNNPGSSGISVNFRSNVAIHHITIVDFSNYAEAVWFFNNNRGYPLPPTIAYAAGNSVHDSAFINSDNRFEGQSGFLYYNNVQTNIAGNVQCLTSDWMKTFIIHDNIFTRAYDPVNWNFWGELYHFSDNSEIYKNIFNGAGTLDLSDVRKGDGAWGLKVYNNQFLVSAVGPDNLNYNVHSISFEGWGALQYIYVFNNYFKNPPAAISVGGSNAANCVYPDGVHWALDHIYIYYNIFENAGNTNNPAAATIWLWDYAAPGYIYNHIWDNIFVENNVIISTTSPNQIQGIYLSISTPAANFHIDNNIITGYPWVPIKFQYGSSFNTVSIQDNLFYQNGEDRVSWGGNPTNKIENNLVGNPLFVSSTDFHLAKGSPAIDKGISISGLASDYDGNSVPYPSGGATDIGAYEYHP